MVSRLRIAAPAALGGAGGFLDVEAVGADIKAVEGEVVVGDGDFVHAADGAGLEVVELVVRC